MARAFQQTQTTDPRPGSAPEWQSLRSELAALLHQVDDQMARQQEAPISERVRDLRHQVTEAEAAPDRRADALRAVQRQMNRFGEQPAPAQMPSRDSLQAAIDQIRTRQGVAPRPATAPVAPAAPADAAAIDRLARSVGDISGRLERIEGDIRTQIRAGGNVQDVADQVAQLAHVVELLAGAVGETGQVKRLEGQIASLGRIMSQGRETDLAAMTRRLDDVASTVGKLADLQVHFGERVNNPIESTALRDGMSNIEASVRAIYDRIDTLERQTALSPADIETITGELARFTQGMRGEQPQHLIELVDALNQRISEIESGDRLVQALRGDLDDLRDSVASAVTPRFEAIDRRLDALTAEASTRADMTEISRQLGMLGDRLDDRGDTGSISQLEAQVRQLVARMDQTGEQLASLARLYAEPQAATMPQGFDYDTLAETIASRTAEAMVQASQDNGLTQRIAGLEERIVAMLEGMRETAEPIEVSGMQAGISEVNERLRRLEASLSGRASNEGVAEHAAVADVPLFATPAAPDADIAAIIADADSDMPAPAMRRRDEMPRNPAADAPLIAPAFPDPVPEEAPARKFHPGLDEDLSLAARYDMPVAAPSRPAPPVPSADFAPKGAVASQAEAGVTASSRNTFIEAARRAAQRKPVAQPVSEAASGSLIGRALARFHSASSAAAEGEPQPDAGRKARILAGDKPARIKPQPEPMPAPVVETLEPQFNETEVDEVEGPRESFLVRHRKLILLSAALVALGFLTLNLVAQRMLDASGTSAAPQVSDASAVTGTPLLAPNPVAETALAAAPRTVPLDSLTTGSIDQSAARGFAPSSAQALPAAFSAASDLAKSTSLPPLSPTEAPAQFELPPEAIGPLELRKAAARGDARAQFEVAAIYTEGRAVPQDYAAAALWYERSAASGFAPAQYRLGSLYENGNGVDKNLESARSWYERAAKAGNRMSMHNLAAIYAGGQLGQQQFEEAAKWFEEAARRGLTDSQFNLGMLHARGLGVPQSLEESFTWFGIAALSGDKDATKARDDIARTLDAETMTRLTDIVNNFRPAPIDLAANFAPIGTWTANFDPGETINDRNIVATVQRALTRLGYEVGTSDGLAGTKTAAAIKSFELATGMSEVGLINPRLLAVLGSQPV
jgi:localization factor PodJL